ncbi:MAG: hypothetical protein ACREQL_11890 [Candidatus Binatia bacterium]
MFPAYIDPIAPGLVPVWAGALGAELAWLVWVGLLGVLVVLVLVASESLQKGRHARAPRQPVVRHPIRGIKVRP